MSSISRDGRSFSSTWFTDHSPGGGRVGAVVLWRMTRPRHRIPVRPGILHWLVGLFFVRTMILPILWRRGFYAWMHGSFKAADEWRAERERPDSDNDPRWSSTAGQGDERVGFDERRRVVGFRGRIFGPPPEGHALLLMIEDVDDYPEGVRVIEHSIPTPRETSPRPAVDQSRPKAERHEAIRAWNRERHAVWSAALQADPEYRRFMEG